MPSADASAVQCGCECSAVWMRVQCGCECSEDASAVHVHASADDGDSTHNVKHCCSAIRVYPCDMDIDI